MEFIPDARVPVLQYMSNQFGISCDISINNYPGRVKSRIFYWINTIDERFGDMILLVRNQGLMLFSLCYLVNSKGEVSASCFLAGQGMG
jgi:hypothetical protein